MHYILSSKIKKKFITLFFVKGSVLLHFISYFACFLLHFQLQVRIFNWSFIWTQL